MKIQYFGIILLLCLSCAYSMHLKTTRHMQASNSYENGISQSVIEAVKLYRNDEQVEKAIDSAVESQPDLLKKFTCKNDPNYHYVTIDQPSKDNAVKKQVIISCNVHARQLLTTEVCVDFVTALANITKGQSAQSQYNLYNQFDQSSITQLLNATRLTVFYRGNDERDSVINGKDYCIRKDKNNIDINRNFPTNFNFEHDPKQSEQYPGDNPLSEPFSQCLDTYLQQINQSSKISIFIDIHTGQFTLYDSFQSQSNKTNKILQRLKHKYCPQCRISSLGNENDDQVSNGEIFPDIKKRYNADHSVLLQIYGGYNDHLDNQQNCIAIFNPLTQKELNYYKQLWKKALLFFIKESVRSLNK